MDQAVLQKQEMTSSNAAQLEDHLARKALLLPLINSEASASAKIQAIRNEDDKEFMLLRDIVLIKDFRRYQKMSYKEVLKVVDRKSLKENDCLLKPGESRFMYAFEIFLTCNGYYEFLCWLAENEKPSKMSTRRAAAALGCDHSTLIRSMQKAGFSECKDETIREYIEKHAKTEKTAKITTRKIAEALGCDHSTLIRRMQKAGFRNCTEDTIRQYLELLRQKGQTAAVLNAPGMHQSRPSRPVLVRSWCV